MPGQEKTIIGARELLGLFLDFQVVTPVMRKWTEKGLADNKPRLIRFQRLVALFKAFGIQTTVSSFDEGEFIDVTNPAYGSLLAKIKQDFDSEGALRWWIDKKGRSPSELRYVFRTSLEYRVKLESVLGFNSGVKEATGLYYYAHQKTGEMNRAIHSHLGIIEDLLIALISPSDAKFDEADLGRDFGYPLIDLFEIDVDSF